MSLNYILILAAVFLLILALWILLLRKKKFKNTSRLELDPVGLWRYHSDSEFEKKLSYGLARESEKPGSKNPKADKEKKPVAVLEFNGDIRAKQHRGFASLVDEVCVNKDKVSEVVVVITSPGGMVAQYGHVYSQMERLRGAVSKLTVCIDVVAASGGYLMSLPANKIIAAPFSMVGSIGVVAFVPNARKLLNKFDIEPRTFTAGNLKRTVGLFDDASEEEVEHFQGQLETIHSQFLAAVKKYRPQVKFEEIETGAHWSAEDSVSKELGLVDEIGCSEHYLITLNEKEDLIFIKKKKGSFLENGILGLAGAMVDRAFDNVRGAGAFH
jgi:serine protease SohB